MRTSIAATLIATAMVFAVPVLTPAPAQAVNLPEGTPVTQLGETKSGVILTGGGKHGARQQRGKYREGRRHQRRVHRGSRRHNRDYGYRTPSRGHRNRGHGDGYGRGHRYDRGHGHRRGHGHDTAAVMGTGMGVM